jgi:general stress protein 26
VRESTSEEAVVAQSNQDQGVAKIAELIKRIKFAMLTTVCEDGSLHSRPMAAQDIDFDGTLWFYTRADAPKVTEASQHEQVSVTFADPDSSKFVSASGTATIVRDRGKLEEFWKPHYKVLFPEGLDDPQLALLRVDVTRAEYWDSANTSLGRAFDFARAYVTGDPSKLGEHAKVAVK